MKKKIISILVLGMYFFGGFGMVFAEDSNNPNDPQSPFFEFGGGWIPAGWETPTWWTPTSSDGGKTDLSSDKFMFDPNQLSPSSKPPYNKWTTANVTGFLLNLGKMLLIGVSTLAVLSITIGGIMIATTGPSDRAAKGKTIISLNIIAIVIALLSYSIIQIVRWVLSV